MSILDRIADHEELRLVHSSSTLTVRQAATDYIERGWRVVPLVPGEKACVNEPAWKKLNFKPEDFGPNDNIGLKQGDGLIDIDLDAVETVACASDFLEPPSNSAYGRPSKPGSHRAYRSQVDRAIKHVDLCATDKKKATLVEIRVDHQSMAPPSRHPDGELLTWMTPPVLAADVTSIEGPELERQVNLIATTAMIIRYYSAPGARHDWMLALAGFMRHLGITSVEAAKLMTSAGRLAHDVNLPDRLKEVHDTYAKGDDEPLKAEKALKELMVSGDKFAASLRKIWSADITGISRSRLEELNAKHAVIFQQSGDLVVITEDRHLDGRYFVRFSSPETIRQLYPASVQVGVSSRGAPMMKRLGAAWLDSTKRRQYNGIELAPGKRQTPGYYNLWRGFAVEPKKGDCSLFQKHIDLVIANGNAEMARYIRQWMSKTVQEPDRPVGTAIALRGGQGTGKGTFATAFGELFGCHFLHLDSTHRLTGNFNAHLHEAIVVFADEAVWAGGHAGLGALNRMITEKTLTIERKGIDVLSVPNLLHMIVASNADWVVPAAFDNRRFAVTDVSDAQKNNSKYFDAIWHELQNGGLAALLHDLLEYGDDLDLRQIPKTKALDDQKRHTADPEWQWWREVLTDETFWKDTNSGWALIRDVFINYSETLKAANKKGERSMQTSLGKFLRGACPQPVDPRAERYPRKEGRGYEATYTFPGLRACRDHYDRHFGIAPANADWPAVIEEQQGLLR